MSRFRLIRRRATVPLPAQSHAPVLSAVAGLTAVGVKNANRVPNLSAVASMTVVHTVAVTDPGLLDDITLVGAGAAVVGNAAGLTPPLPSGLALDDFMVGEFWVAARTATVTLPAGWTAFPGSPYLHPTAPSLQIVRCWKRALASGNVAPVFGLSGAATGVATMARVYALRGVSTTSPIGLTGPVFASTAGGGAIGPISGIQLSPKQAVVAEFMRATDHTSIAPLSGDSLTWSELFEMVQPATTTKAGAAVNMAVNNNSSRLITGKTYVPTGGGTAANSIGMMVSFNPGPEGGPPPDTSLPLHVVERRAYEMWDMLGMNINLNVSGGPINRPRVLQGMAFLGLDQIRSNVVNPAQPPSAGILVDAGLRIGSTVCDRATSYNDLKADLNGKRSFEIAHPGSIMGIEGVNEILNFGGHFAYIDRNAVNHGMGTGSNNAPYIAYQNDLYFAVKSDPFYDALSHIDVRHFTGPPSIVEGDCDSVNFHPYAHPYLGVYPSYIRNRYEFRSDMDPYPTPPYVKRVVFTESGFSNLRSYRWGVDDLTQAIATVMSLFLCVELNIYKIFYYELFDGAGGSNRGQGVFVNGNPYFIPKPSAYAIKHLFEIIADTGATKATFTKVNARYRLNGMPATAKHTTIQKSNGNYYVFIWNDSDPIWEYHADDANPTGVPITPAASHPLTLEVPAGKQVQWFSPLDSVTPGAVPTLHKKPLIARIF